MFVTEVYLQNLQHLKFQPDVCEDPGRFLKPSEESWDILGQSCSSDFRHFSVHLLDSELTLVGVELVLKNTQQLL